jgi:hypothetical protein
MEINKKNAALILLTLVAFGAIMGGVLLTIHAADTNSTNTNTTITTPENLGLGFSEAYGGCRGFGRHGFGGFGPAEVSAEYNQTVTSIAENDSDVQNLTAQGYSIIDIRPIIKNVVDGQGNVTLKATTAIVVLKKDTSGYATALVDIEQSKVTEIVTLTRTVIEK